VSEANSNKKNGKSLDDLGADQRRKRSSSVEEQQGSGPQVRVSASSPSVPPNNSSSYIKNRSSTTASHSPSHHHHLNNTPTSSSSAHGHRSPHHDTRRRSEQVRLSIIGGNGISAEIQAQAASVVADLKSFEENLLKEIGPSDQSQSSGLGFGNLDNLSLSLSMFPPIVPEDSEEWFPSSTLKSSQYSMSPRIEEGLPLPKLGHSSSDDHTRRFSTTLAALIDLPPGSRPSFLEGLPHMQAIPVTPSRGQPSSPSSASSAPGFSSRREGVSFATVGPSTMISSEPILLPERTHSASVSEAITPVSSASTSAIPSPNRRKHQRSKSHAVFDNNIPITRDLMAGTYGRRTDNSKAANRNSTDIYQTIRHKTPKGVRIAIEEYVSPPLFSSIFFCSTPSSFYLTLAF
jgi:hypothetical protein